jgi:hypothetical protein
MFFGCAALLFAPFAVKVIHLHRDTVGVEFAGTENNHFLLGAAVQAKLFKQILAHGSNAFRHQQLAVKMPGSVLVFDFFLPDFPAGFGINRLGFEYLVAGESFAVYRRAAFDDFTGGQITVLLGLYQRIFVNRFTKVFEVVGGNERVIFVLRLGFPQLSGRGSQTDLYGIWIAQ